jgi:DNA-binding transcriptional regulator YhcF (GntR family)
MTRRSRHMLFARIAVDALRNKGRLPTSRSVALVARVHPATARRWLADVRAIATAQASALTAKPSRKSA